MLKAFREEITGRTNITNFERDSKVHALSKVFTEEIVTLREDQISVIYANQLSNASGRALDEFGDKLGLPRIKSKPATVNRSEINLAFYVETGTFGSINGAASIPLPASVKIASDPNTNELNTTVEYQLLSTYTLPSGSAIYYVTARAVNFGTSSNVGTGVLRQHDFTNYVDSANNSLKVVNFYPILNGTDDEQDDVYRFRLANHYNRMMQNNDIRMKLSALEVPGVVNTRVEPGYFGIGTAAVFALGAENQANTSLLNALQDRLDYWKAPGGETFASSATEVFFDFEVEVSPTRSLNNSEILRLKSEINRSFLAYFRRLTLGSVVDLQVLLESTQQKLTKVASFGQRAGNKVFKKVYVRKGFSGGATDERSKLVGSTYSLAADEFPSLGTLLVEIV